MTVRSTDDKRAAPPAVEPAAGPRGLPQRAGTLPVRPRNRVPLATLEATFAGLLQVDETRRPAQPLTPPVDLWPPVTGATPRVTR